MRINGETFAKVIARPFRGRSNLQNNLVGLPRSRWSLAMTVLRSSSTLLSFLLLTSLSLPQPVQAASPPGTSEVLYQSPFHGVVIEPPPKPVEPAVGEVQLQPVGLSKIDVFQAEQWLRNAKSFWGAGDYSTVEYYCRMLIAVYPQTAYAREAAKFLKKMENPKKNRIREYIRKNPGIFPY